MGINVNSILSKAAAKNEAKPSKTKTPTVELPKHAAAIDSWLKAHSDKKDAEARMATAEVGFLSDVEVARLAECRRDGKYYSSVKVNDKITISTQNRYSPIDSKDHEMLEEVFGAKTGDYFKPKTEISLTEAALNDETILQKLIIAVGEDKFATYFKVDQHIQPTETFHEARATNTEVGEKAQKLIESGVVRPYKNSVKFGA